MVFSSTIFLFFYLPITLLGYYLLDRRYKNVFLLIASLLFYAWGEPKFVFIMMFSIVINYALGLLVDREKGNKPHQRVILTFMVLFNLSLFFVFKYLNFTIRNLNFLLNDKIPQTNIALPIGISFFTFQAMSYVFDVYRGKGKVQKNLLNVALYISFFPQLIAGPIVRYETVALEINSRQENLNDFSTGVRRFIIGLCKKLILSNSLAIIADKAFGYTDFTQLTVSLAWLGLVSYAFQVYYDFSGYSDMAIGLGLMFGFHFNENFNYPYISKTIPEFWQRWHISLGSWFRDYLFYPISISGWSMNLGKFARQKWGRTPGKVVPAVVGLAIVWFLTGLWHGASWVYIIWGCFYGFLLILSLIFQPIIKKITEELKINTKSYWFKGIQICRTLFLVLIADVFFRAPGTWNAFRYLGSMFGLMGNSISDSLSQFLFFDSAITIIISVIAATPILKALMNHIPKKYLFNVRCATDIIEVIMLIVCVSYVVNTAYDPFIYFNF